MHDWDSCREKATLLKFLETFALLLVTQLSPDPSAVPFLIARAHPLQTPATHVDPLGWLELSSAQRSSLPGLISAHPGLTYNRNTCESQPVSEKAPLKA